MHDFVFYKFYSSHIISLLHFEVYSYDYSQAILDLLINITCPVSIKRNYRPYTLIRLSVILKSRHYSEYTSDSG